MPRPSALTLGRRLVGGNWLDQTATVYTIDPTLRTFTVAAKTGLACKLATVNRLASDTTPQRNVPADARTLDWEHTYVMPETARIAVSSEPGVLYSIVAGTVEPVVGPGNAILYRRCDVVRARA